MKKAVFKIKELAKYCDIFKILADSKLVGFIALNPNHWCPGEFVFGEEMAIQSRYQNKGIGKQVFNQIFEMYKKKGYKKFIGIANNKGMAINLYKRLGIIESTDNVVIEKAL